MTIKEELALHYALDSILEATGKQEELTKTAMKIGLPGWAQKSLLAA